MPILATIQFEKDLNGQKQKWTESLDNLSLSQIEDELNMGANALIINKFQGRVSLQEMIQSTTQSMEIMGQASRPVDIMAIMERGSSLGMAISDIKKTGEIMGFAGHPQRGITVAVMYEKSVTKFFLTVANQLLPNANFIVAETLDDAYAMIDKYRATRG